MLRLWTEQARESLRGAQWTFAFALAAAVVVYGARLFLFSMGIDDEFVMLGGADHMFLQQGRWAAAALIKSLLPISFAPFFSPLIALLLLAAAAATMSVALNLRGTERVIFGVLFAAFPQFAYQLVFTHLAPCVAFGLLLTALAYLAFALHRRTGQALFLLPALACCVFALGTDAGLVFVPPMLFVLDSLGRLVSRADAEEKGGPGQAFSLIAELRFGLQLLLLLGAALVCHTALAHASAAFMNLALAPVPGPFSGWEAGEPGAVAALVGKVVGKHLRGQAYFGEKLFVAAYLPLLCISITVLGQSKGWARIRAVPFLLCALLLPFAPIIGAGHAASPQALLTQGMLFAGLWSLAFRLAPAPRVVAACVLTLAVLFSSAHVSRLFFQNHLSYQADLLLGNRIAAALYQACPDLLPEQTRVYLHGMPESVLRPLPKADVFGSSFFRHDGGNLSRQLAFLRVTGIAAFARPDKETIQGILPQVERLPLWPRQGSIEMIDGILTIRLGEKAGVID
jgi:hypothetical protein